MINNMKSRNTKLLLIDFFYLLLLFVLYAVAYISPVLGGKVFLIFAIFSSIQQIMNYKSSDYLVVLLIFGLLYWLFMIPFYFYDIPYHYLLEYQTIESTNFIVFLQLIFLRLMFFGINPNSLIPSRYVLEIKANTVIFCSIVVLLVGFIL